jgi:tetratricopeptide (TPR) repeat protein
MNADSSSLSQNVTMLRYLPAAAIFAAVIFLLVYSSKPETSPGSREELKSYPGAVAYAEGVSLVPEQFDNAKRLLANNQVALAEQIYRDIIKVEPQSAPGLIGLGSCQLVQGALDDAFKNYDAALKLDSRSTQALLGLAAVVGTRQQHQAALDYYKRVRELDGQLPEAYWGLAVCHDELKQWEQALLNYRRFLELAPDSIHAARVRERIQELAMLLEN